jgi:hypothetical protein
MSFFLTLVRSIGMRGNYFDQHMLARRSATVASSLRLQQS